MIVNTQAIADALASSVKVDEVLGMTKKAIGNAQAAVSRPPRFGGPVEQLIFEWASAELLAQAVAKHSMLTLLCTLISSDPKAVELDIPLDEVGSSVDQWVAKLAEIINLVRSTYQI